MWQHASSLLHPGHETGGLEHRLAYDFMLENICYLIIHVVVAVVYDN
jgi:hypothetical protein